MPNHSLCGKLFQKRPNGNPGSNNDLMQNLISNENGVEKKIQDLELHLHKGRQ